MDRQSHWSIVEQQIDSAVSAAMPYGGGATITEHRLRHHLNQVAKTAFQEGQSYALLSLLTVDDVAEQLNISPRRVRAIAKIAHERWAIGYQVPGTNTWLFRPEELDSLRPGPPGRPRKPAP